MKCFSAVKRAKLRRSRLGARECLLLSVFSFCFFENKQWSKMIVRRVSLARSLAVSSSLFFCLALSFSLSVCLSLSLSLSLSYALARSLSPSLYFLSRSLILSFSLSFCLSRSLALCLFLTPSPSPTHASQSLSSCAPRTLHRPALQICSSGRHPEACTRRRHPGGGPVLCFAAAREMGVPVVPGTHMHFDYSA